MNRQFPGNIVDPKTGEPHVPGATGKRIIDGIIDLLDMRNIESAILDELKIFDSIPTKGLCYFRKSFIVTVVTALKSFFPDRDSDLSFVEIGGGEGYLARAFKKENPNGDVYVCDLSMEHLRMAPSDLIRIRCDARLPYLAPNSVDIAVFWVSLHHFSLDDMKAALGQAVTALKPNGKLILFEPNGAFLPRHLVMRTPLRHLVYFDDEEKPIDIRTTIDLLRPAGLTMHYSCGVNPPYSLDFLRKLPGGMFFYWFVESLYQFDRFARKPLGKTLYSGNQRLWLGSYVFAAFSR